MRKPNELEFGMRAFANGRFGSKLRIGIPKRDAVPALRVESDSSRANRVFAMAMDGRIFEDIERDEDVRPFKPKWNVKRVCRSCANSVYDLGRNPTTCPRCGTRFDREPPLISSPSLFGAAANPIIKWR